MPVKISINDAFLSLEIVFIIANSVDPEEMPPEGHFILGFTICQSKAMPNIFFLISHPHLPL